jgi:multidrug efflux pump subunit AcrA (membrane-fusion protein)
MVTALISLGMDHIQRSARAGQAAGTKISDDGKSSALAFHKVGRGDVVVTVVERGLIEPIDNAPIICKLRNNERGVASTIKWLIEDGDSVKSGDKVAELDDPGLRDQVSTQEIVVAEKKALLEQAVKDRELATQQGKLELEIAEDNVEVVDIELQEAPDKDKRKMEVRLRQAKRAVEMAKIQTRIRQEKAEAAMAPRKVAFDAELGKVADLKQQLAACVLTAPRDGLVIYHIPERARWSGEGTIAVGEKVRQGQVLMTIPDLRRLQVILKIPETVVTRLRPNGRAPKQPNPQQARIRVDAFPSRVLKGSLQTVAMKAETPAWFASEVNVFHTTVILAPGQGVNGLKPGMTAEVTIFADERKDVLRLPAQAVLVVRGDRICYVKGADGVEQRRVVLGESNDVFVEVKEGLKEGEEVVLNPQSLRAPRKPPARGQGRLAPFGAADVLARSVRPTGEDSPGTGIERYGLTLTDLARIEDTIPGLAMVAPSRLFATMTVRNPLTGSNHFGVVATTPAYGVVHGLDDYLVDEGQRFLADQDQEHFAAVAVLGAEAARKLFPGDEPLGQTVRISGHPFRVVGVLRERPAPVKALNHDSEVYIPLATSRRLFGKVSSVRKAGSFRTEEVDFTEVHLVLRDRNQAQVAAAAVRGLLEHYHDQQDWQVIAP